MPICEVRSQRACNGQCIRLYEASDDKTLTFYACIGCVADLRRSGARFRELDSNKRPKPQPKPKQHRR